MRKLIVLQFLLVMAHLTMFAQGQTDRIKDRLNGPVKSVRIEQSLLEEKESGEISESTRVPSQDISYNHEGNYEEIVYYEDTGTVLWKLAIRYNLAGVKLEELAYEAEGISKYLYKYSPNGRNYRITEYDPDGSLSGREDVVCDANGKEIRRKRYGANGAIISRYVYRYDQKGKKIEEILYGRNAAPAHAARRRTYSYYPDGNVSEESGYETPKGGFLGKRIYKYDDEGNLEEEYSQRKDGNIFGRVKYSYEFDSHQNWIKRTTHKETVKEGQHIFESQIITYRTITYF